MRGKRLILTLSFSGLALSLFAVPYVTRQVTAWVQQRTHGFRLEEASHSLGIDFVHELTPPDAKIQHVWPVVIAVGTAVSITDVNSDGLPDIYATTSRFGGKNRLYVNRGGKGFEELGERAGLADLNRPEMGVSTGSAWADYDNDGHEDVLVYRFGYLDLFRNNGDGTFTHVTDQAGLAGQWIYAYDAMWWDFDRDGCLDIYVGAYYRPEHDLWHLKTTRLFWDSVTTARNGGRNKLYHHIKSNGRCTGGFKEVSETYGVDDPGWTVSVGAADLDGNGYPDLYVANDVGPDSLFMNVDGTRFEPLVGSSGIGRDSKKGMNVAFGDFRNTGRLSVYVSNITRAGYLVEGNMLWENLGGGRFRDAAWDLGAADGGWSWGAQFGDLNNDGFQDLYVTNGMVSGDDPGQEYWYEFGVISRGGGFILQDPARWPPLGRKGLQGFERNRLFLNDGSGRFRDVAEAAGIKDRFGGRGIDGRGVVLVDLQRKGALDIVVANQRGPLLVYLNRVDPDRKWIQFDLRGSRSNRSAIGAQVTLHWNDQRHLQEVDTHGGYAGHRWRVLHFGLGRDPVLRRAEIRWPSGQTQTLTGLEANRLYVVNEPGA